MSKLILGIGLPGSGKTTILKPFALKHGYTYISPDEIRAEISGDAIIQTDMKQVWDRVREETTSALKEGRHVVIDATFVKGSERRDFITFAREHGATGVYGAFAAVPLEVAKERNQTRSRVVPEYAMERMHRFLEEDTPELNDGFDSIVDLHNIEELEATETFVDRGVYEKEFKQRFR